MQHLGGALCDRTKNICEADYTHTWAKSIVMKSRDQVTFSPTSCRQTNDGSERTLKEQTQLASLLSLWSVLSISNSLRFPFIFEN